MGSRPGHSSRFPCWIDGKPGGTAYHVMQLCPEHKRLAHGYCWRKRQGMEPEDITPSGGGPGHAYLCVLCGYWHWTSSEEPHDADLAKGVDELRRLFERRSFHINVARGWDRVYGA